MDDIKQSKQNFNVSVIISALLIAGSCIGAGMLGLPIITGLAGFVPTLIVMLFVWGFMLLTAKLLIEANSWFQGEINILTLSEKILGRIGRWTASVLFLFLFYLLLTAYLLKGGELIEMFFLKNISVLSHLNGSTVLFILSVVIVACGADLTGKFNAFFMIILFLSFFSLLLSAVPHIEWQYLEHHNYQDSWFLIPYLITSFGFHNMVPSVRNYLKLDDKKLIQAIHLGALIPLFIYLFWIFVMIGVIPLQGEHSIASSFQQNQIATEPLGYITNSSFIAYLGLIFSFAAIITSVLGQGLSMVDFFKDLLSSQKKIGPVLLTFVPPYLFSKMEGAIFFKCLSFAGGFAAILLYGFLPGLIVYCGRYRKNYTGCMIACRTKCSLIMMMLLSLIVFALEWAKVLGWISII